MTADLMLYMFAFVCGVIVGFGVCVLMSHVNRAHVCTRRNRNE